jgi:hypothetical protein
LDFLPSLGTEFRKEQSMAKRVKVKNSLVGNINKRRKLGISRPKSESTVDPRQYQQMKKGWK